MILRYDAIDMAPHGAMGHGGGGVRAAKASGLCLLVCFCVRVRNASEWKLTGYRRNQKLE